MIKWIILGLMFIVSEASSPSLVVGRDWYFSDCAVGCRFSGFPCNVNSRGTQGDPFCLDPGNDGVKDSFAYLQDGAQPELAAGDNVYLCAGLCDGSGTASYTVGKRQMTPPSGVTCIGGDSNKAWLVPRTSGNSVSRITIQSYPGEFVYISGDTNGNNTIDSTDTKVLVSTCDSADQSTLPSYWTWKNMGVEKATVGFHLYSQTNLYDGAWIWDGVIFQRFGAQWLWNDQEICNGVGSSCDINTQCSIGDVYPLNAGNHMRKGFTIRNSIFRHICGPGTRIVTARETGAVFLMDSNEFYNMYSAANDFDIRNGQYIWRNNYVHDVFQGIQIENGVQNATIEDNVITCPGTYNTRRDHNCLHGISVNNGDTPGCSGDCLNSHKNINIHRNVFVGNTTAGSAKGMSKCIDFQGICTSAGSCTYDNSFVIQNNVCIAALSTESDEDGFTANTGIYVDSPNSTRVEFNTIARSAHTVLSIFGAADHVVRGNIIYDTNLGSSGNTSWPPVIMDSSMDMNDLSFNLISDAAPSANPNVVGRCSPGCNGSSDIVATCANLGDGSHGLGNFCATPTFRSNYGNNSATCSTTPWASKVPYWHAPITNADAGAAICWDEHLPNTDVISKDKVTNVGNPAYPTDDIDQGSRQGLLDVGADEIALPNLLFSDLSAVPNTPLPDPTCPIILYTGHNLTFDVTYANSGPGVGIATGVQYSINIPPGGEYGLNYVSTTCPSCVWDGGTFTLTCNPNVTLTNNDFRHCTVTVSHGGTGDLPPFNHTEPCKVSVTGMLWSNEVDPATAPAQQIICVPMEAVERDDCAAYP